MNALIVKEDGLIYVNEVPEEPNWGDCADDNAMDNYYVALASVKESAILCIDQEQVKALVMRYSSMGMDKDGFYQPTVGIHPIPGLTFEVKTVKALSVTQQVAILSVKEEIKV
jgi:hypothetical protein